MIELRDSDGNENYVEEGSDANVTASFSFSDVTFNKDGILSLVVTLYNLNTKAVINSRNAQDILDANNGTVSDAGVLTLSLGPDDNVIVDTSSVGEGEIETHVLRLEWTWNDGVRVRKGREELSFIVERLLVVS